MFYAVSRNIIKKINHLKLGENLETLFKLSQQFHY